MSTIKTDSLVRVKPAVVKRLLVSLRKQVEGRVGIVASVFTPLGSKTPRARVNFMRARSKKVNPTAHIFYVNDLELAEPQS